MFWWIVGIAALGMVGYFLFWPLLVSAFAFIVALQFSAVFTLFAVGTLWFWLLLAAESGLMCCYFLSESDDDEPVGAGATVSMVVTIALVCLFGNFLSVVWSNIAWVLMSVVGYLAVGVLHVYLRSGIFTKEADNSIDDLAGAFAREKNISKDRVKSDPGMREAFRIYVREQTRYGKSAGKRVNPTDGKVWISDHKARHLVWLGYWPWSFLWYIGHDIINKILNGIYRLMLESLQRLSDHNTKNSQQYFSAVPPADEPPPPAVPPDGDVSVDIEKHGYGARDPRLLPPDMHR